MGAYNVKLFFRELLPFVFREIGMLAAEKQHGEMVEKTVKP
jgi:hypothetical protein